MKFLWLSLFLCVCILPRSAAIGSSGCNSQCSLEEMNQFWGGCCCVQCVSGYYVDLPDGVSSDDPLPWWTCCDFARPYYDYFFYHVLILVAFYNTFWFWYHGYAFEPTSIVELSRPANEEREEPLDYRPRTILSGRVVRHVSLHSNKAAQDSIPKQEDQQIGPSGTDHAYCATIEVFDQRDATDTRPIDVQLKSFETYNLLQDYCQARKGKWWKTTTTDASNPTNGHHLILLGANNDKLLMYRPWSYNTRWKLEFFFSFFDTVVASLCLLAEVPAPPGILFVLFTNIVILLLTKWSFSVFGYHGKGGRMASSRNQRDLPDALNDYVEMHNNPRETLV